MADFIHVHCPKCNRGIRAPRAAAGRWGKCPSCQNRMYVPTPDDELEEIPLAPLEDDDERMAREARRVEEEILRQKDEDAGTAGGRGPAERKAPDSPARPAVQIPDVIIAYLVAMKDSDLDKAGKLAAQLTRVRSQALSRVQQMMVDAMPPPQLGDIPPGLFVGFLKKLEQSLEKT